MTQNGRRRRIAVHRTTEQGQSAGAAGYTERCTMTGEDWEYMETCIPAEAARIIVHTFRHRCATASKNGAREFNRAHVMHADRSLYINVPASAKYTREVRS